MYPAMVLFMLYKDHRYEHTNHVREIKFFNLMLCKGFPASC